MINVKLLTSINILNHEEILEKYFKSETFSNGQAVITKDDKDLKLFIVVSGNAIVKISDDHRVVFSPGDFFGELSFIDKQPRSAKVVATSNLRVAVIDQETMESLVIAYPALAFLIYKNLSVELASRIRKTNDVVHETLTQLRTPKTKKGPAWLRKVQKTLTS